jgi:hypothetical protein
MGAMRQSCVRHLPVCGNNCSLLNLHDVARNNLVGLDFLQGTVSENNGLQGQSLLQFFDNASSLEFLDETDTSVQQQKSANDTKVDPVLQTSGENGSGLHDELNRTDKVAEELENEIFLLKLELIETVLFDALDTATPLPADEFKNLPCDVSR